jgi:hypothetical protein
MAEYFALQAALFFASSHILIRRDVRGGRHRPRHGGG